MHHNQQPDWMKFLQTVSLVLTICVAIKTLSD
jgi:hypothetical protein